MIDIDEIRDAHIGAFGLSKADDTYTFYHDETNNIKKLRLDAQGLNVAEPAIFVLGGIVHSGAPRVLDIQPLRDAMSIQKNRRRNQTQARRQGRVPGPAQVRQARHVSKVDF